MRQSPLFSNISTGNVYSSADSATYSGISIKTFILLAVTIIVGCITATVLPSIQNFSLFYMVLVVSSIVGFISVLIGRMSSSKASYCSFIYAFCEGLFLGAITSMFDAMVRGISTIAVVGTITIFGTMLLLYATGIIRVGSKMRKFLWGMTIGALALTLVTSLLSLTGVFNGVSIGLIIALEAFFLLYGVFTLLLNFQEATYVVDAGCDKKSEWSVALGLSVSVIYIYVEILRFVYYIALTQDR